MKFLVNFLLTILAFILLKFLISYTEKSKIKLNKLIELSKIEKGLLSLKDLSQENYSRFLKIVNMYLASHEFHNIVMLEGGSSELTNFIGIINNERVYISSIQIDLSKDSSEDENSWNTTGKEDIQRFITRMLQSNCKKGIIINNCRFANESIKFVEDFNSKNNSFELKLIDGYELTKTIRLHRNYSVEEYDDYELQ